MIKTRVTVDLKKLTMDDRSPDHIQGALSNVEGAYSEYQCKLSNTEASGEWVIDISHVNAPGTDMAQIYNGKLTYYEVKSGYVSKSDFTGKNKIFYIDTDGNLKYNAEKAINNLARVTEYMLPMALVPLCEYKLEPNEENKQEAVKGLEYFIDGIKDTWDKEQALLYYYYYLKDAFPDVYNVQMGPVSKMAKAKSSEKLILPSSQDDIRGKIVVFDREGSGSLEVFGTINELEEYVVKVSNLGDYPTLSFVISNA